jgi:alpha-1,3-mannosyltransferase
MTPAQLDIMGVLVCAMTAGEAVAALDAGVEIEPLRLAYLNAHGSNIAGKDSRFHQILKSFTVFNDGVGLDIAAWLLHGRRFPENLNGTDFTVRYLRDTRRDWTIYLLGAKPGIAEAAGEALAKMSPRHRIVGVQDGYFDPSRSPEIAEQIRRSGAGLLLVAMGNPAQEKWIAEYGAATGCRLMIGVGALFDFLSGGVERAPKWVQDVRAEWVFRLALEPRRLAGRYLIGNPRFLARAIAHKLRPR